jgi:hypothetical protein
MHHLLHNNIVWAAIKAEVVFNRPPAPANPTLTGGRLTSAYPTEDQVIPPDTIYPLIDDEGFSTIPP